ncbi:MAG: hypothetical protein HRU19_13210 [Pseudobacteriovorax sp.]|nr:hypothetical protein [Pseudobacteriovorax sp.]
MKKSTTLIMASLMVSTLGMGKTWQGDGVRYGPDGKKQSQYKLLVDVQEDSHQNMKTNVRVITESDTLEYTCERQKKDHAWTTSCKNSKGGMYCFANNICQEYTVTGETSYATTIIFDSSSSMRLSRTEMKHGIATSFFSEKLVLTD